MALKLVNLDATTRAHMLSEVTADLAAGKLYFSNFLIPTRHADYAALLKQATSGLDDDGMADGLRRGGFFASHYSKRTPSGGTTTSKVPVTAPETLAQGEFNRFYIRGLCLRAIAAGIQDVEVYRARASANPRPESEARIGARINAQALLSDLRAHPGVDTALGVPPGPNSGLSVKLP